MKRPPGFTPPPKPDSERDRSPEGSVETPVTLLGRFTRAPGDDDRREQPRAEQRESASEAADPAGYAGSRRPQWSLRGAIRARRRVERSEVKRFTARARRRRRNALIVVGAVLVVAVGSIGAAYSPLMSVRTITVEGAKLVNSDGIVNDLQSQLGRPFPLIDQREIKAELVKYPLIQSYSIEAVPPSTLVVRLVEREPLGLRKVDGGFALVDAAGVVLRTDADRISGYPIIDADGAAASRGFEAAASVLRALPDAVRSTVDTVTASTRDDVTLKLADSGATVRWGSAEESAVKAKALTDLMAVYPPGEVRLYDVSSSKNVVVQPR